MIDTIIFDYGGVIVHTKTISIIKDAAKKLELRPFPFTMQLLRNNHLLQSGRITEKEVLEKVSRNGSISTRCTPDEYLSFMEDVYSKNSRKNIDTENLVSKLRNSGYKVVLLSNTIPSHVAYNRKNNNFDIFDEVFLSNEICKRKPNSDAYQYVLEKLGKEPEKCVFIDDKSINVRAARNRGINGIVYKGYEDLCLQLDKLGVTFYGVKDRL